MAKSGKKLIDFSWYKADKIVRDIDLKKQAKDLIYLLQLYIEHDVVNIHLLPQLSSMSSNLLFQTGKEHAIKELLFDNRKKL